MIKNPQVRAELLEKLAEIRDLLDGLEASAGLLKAEQNHSADLSAKHLVADVAPTPDEDVDALIEKAQEQMATLPLDDPRRDNLSVQSFRLRTLRRRSRN